MVDPLVQVVDPLVQVVDPKYFDVFRVIHEPFGISRHMAICQIPNVN